MSEVKTVEKKKVAVGEFTVEACNPRNCDLLVQSLTGVTDRRLRSTIKPTTTTIQGQIRTPLAHGMPMPEVPGMQLNVNPAECTVEIIDPLYNDENFRTKLSRFLRAATGMNSGAINGQEVRTGKMDKDRMKTLCREILYFVQAGEMKFVHGCKYDMEDVIQLPGEFLLNPGSTIPNTQPRYEKDLQEFTERLNRLD